MSLTQGFDTSSSTADEEDRSEASGLGWFALDDTRLETSFVPSGCRVCTLHVLEA